MYIPSSGTLSYSSGNLATITVAAMYDTNINTALLHATTVDGYSVVTGDIVLLNGQTNKIQNGIYRILPGSGLVTPVRAILTDGVNTSGVTIYVKNGIINIDTKERVSNSPVSLFVKAYFMDWLKG